MDQAEFRARAEKLISFGQVTEKNIEQLRKLNLAVFPVRYSNKFYTDIVASAQKKEEFTCLGFFSDIMVGAICSRVEPVEDSTSSFKIYIMTIGVLAPYRRIGIGRKLLEQVLKECDKHPECTAVYLHVQVGNDAAIEFYKTFGFEVGEVVKDYYQKLDVTDAVLLTKRPPFS
uniref:N-acetyltransferase domain-containing protein n=1 Tax=Haptolina ericina TaxID=156174 RepID=A0A7S3BM43_9EUKA|mmetsp:Transcript_63253/g.140985  ORF Transcript_63253/g.140985 Transcript_63253/m.140985 type:complete len:173 (+) Transcript_63253:40-558(+)